MDAVELGVSARGRGGVWDDLIRSAANRTLVGTRLRRIADGVVEVGSEVVACWPPGTSDHGDGSGFKGEINEADVDSDGVAPARLLPKGSAGGAVLRRSIDEGRRNSEARRGRDELENQHAVVVGNSRNRRGHLLARARRPHEAAFRFVPVSRARRFCPIRGPS